MSAVDPDLPYMVVAHEALRKRDARAFLGGVNGLFKAFCLRRLAFLPRRHDGARAGVVISGVVGPRQCPSH
jgi:hypothetical protein